MQVSNTSVYQYYQSRL